MKSRTYKAIVNGQLEFESDQLNQAIDLIPCGDGQFHVLVGQRSYLAQVRKTDPERKLFQIDINGELYDISLQDQYDQLIKKLGLSVGGSRKANEIKAPMPGLVLEVSVAVGESVTAGQGLIILEAMKMENIIKAGGDGVVKAIHVGKGEAVDKGAMLIEMED
ncbi:MAG: acetyl-CoA carboxylase biotin carboxyl carrier protein subunit [Bacteroidota bacterium]